ncbi:uncharacterized protein LOC110612676 [Manihot esculenta]|uniref:Uncharacterized protein n=2 Tax=Manihot esculenta TaxID=3983 RepID=A0ACB7HUZ0_MANES|nr:uncharacterized protein LOC110612676 [Manihot esculenta]KAG8656337.1 hypothetical protein MANES_04G123800v8 [Manihot esculenta]
MESMPTFALLLLSSILSFSSVHSSEMSPSATPAQQQPSKASSLFASQLSNAPVPPVDPSLEKICGVTEDPRKCISFMAPYTPGSTDAVSVVAMIMEAIYKQVDRAIVISKKAAKNPSQSPVISSCLNKCVESYNKVIDDLGNAMAASTAHDMKSVDDLLAAASSNFGFCDETFHKNGIQESPMEEIDETLILLAGFGVAISRKLIIKSN